MDRRAAWPLVVAPPLVALALLWPGPLDPLAPLVSAPRPVWLLLFVASSTPAAAALLARATVRDPGARTMLLLSSSGAAAGAAAVTAAVAIVLGKPLLVRGGGAFVLLAASMAATALIAATLALAPASRFRWGLLAGESVIALASAWILGAARAPDEYLRHAMVMAPGWGRASLASLLARRFTAGGDEQTEARFRAIEATLGGMIEGGAFAPPYARWGDDARLVRGWVASRVSASPVIRAADRENALRIAIRERQIFAGDPASRLEPFTADSILARDALALTDGLGSDLDLRYRIAAAWLAMIVHARQIDDAKGEAEAIALVRRLFESAKLDRTHHVMLSTYGLEQRRLIEGSDAAALLAWYDALLTHPWPEPLKKSFAEEAAFVRANPGDGYAPVMQLLRARESFERDPRASLALYEDLLRKWPGSTVAPVAQEELAEVRRAGTP